MQTVCDIPRATTNQLKFSISVSIYKGHSVVKMENVDISPLLEIKKHYTEENSV